MSASNNCFKVYIPTRYVLVGLIFTGFFITSFITSNLSLAIVTMVKEHEDNCTLSGNVGEMGHCPNATNLNVEGDCPLRGIKNDTSESEYEGTYAWSTTVQGAILGSFFYGVAMVQFLAGRGADKLDNRWYVGSCYVLGSVLTILVPMASDVGYALLIAVRAVTGMTQCVLYVCLSTLLIKWIPSSERNRMYAIPICGFSLGQLVGPLVVGWLCKQSFAGGWPSVFYIVGVVALAWAIVWMFLVTDNPKDHPRISDEERNYILQGIQDKGEKTEDKSGTPWKALLTSRPVWYYIVSFVCSGWIIYSRLTLLPNYMSQVLHFRIDENGEVNSLVNGIFTLSSFGSGFVADKILAKKWLSKTNTRKLMEFVGLAGSSLCTLIVIFSGCDSTLVVVFLTLSSFLHGLTTSGDGVLPMDLTPTYTGTLIGISNTFGSATGFVSPLLTGFILDSEGLSLNEKWNIALYISAFLGFLGAGASLLWSAEVQPWDPTYCEAAKLENGKDLILQISNKAKHSYVNTIAEDLTSETQKDN